MKVMKATKQIKVYVRLFGKKAVETYNYSDIVLCLQKERQLKIYFFIFYLFKFIFFRKTHVKDSKCIKNS